VLDHNISDSHCTLRVCVISSAYPAIYQEVLSDEQA